MIPRVLTVKYHHSCYSVSFTQTFMPDNYVRRSTTNDRGESFTTNRAQMKPRVDKMRVTRVENHNTT